MKNTSLAIACTEPVPTGAAHGYRLGKSRLQQGWFTAKSQGWWGKQPHQQAEQSQEAAHLPGTS